MNGKCQAGLAAAPAMGWNSWHAFGATVTEDEVKVNVDYLDRHGLRDFGWEYVVVDILWYTPGSDPTYSRWITPYTMDEYGRFIPSPERFPSAGKDQGFKPLADYVHDKGFKFGIHIMRGIPRQAVEHNCPVLGTGVRAADIADRSDVCPWNNDMYGVDTSKPGAQEYYDSMFKLYAGWGVDYVKVDDIAVPYHKEEVEAIRDTYSELGINCSISR